MVITFVCLQLFVIHVQIILQNMCNNDNDKCIYTIFTRVKVEKLGSGLDQFRIGPDSDLGLD